MVELCRRSSRGPLSGKPALAGVSDHPADFDRIMMHPSHSRSIVHLEYSGSNAMILNRAGGVSDLIPYHAEQGRRSRNEASDLNASSGRSDREKVLDMISAESNALHATIMVHFASAGHAA